jgi:hypothetical protein
MRTFLYVSLALVISTSLGCRLDELIKKPDEVKTQPGTQPGKVCRDMQLPISPIKVFPLAHVRDHRRGHETGDTEMSGHNPEITITADIDQEGSNLIVRGTVEMEEDRSDWTTFAGRYERKLTTVGAECQYAGVDRPNGQLRARGGNNNHSWTKYQGSGLIKEADCRSDTMGNDVGELGCTIVFHPVMARFANK